MARASWRMSERQDMQRVIFPILHGYPVEGPAGEVEPFQRIEVTRRSPGLWHIPLPSYNLVDGARWVDQLRTIYRGLQVHESRHQLNYLICSPRFYDVLSRGAHEVARPRVATVGPQSLVIEGITIEPEAWCSDDVAYLADERLGREFAGWRGSPTVPAPDDVRRQVYGEFSVPFHVDDSADQGQLDALRYSVHQVQQRGRGHPQTVAGRVDTIMELQRTLNATAAAAADPHRTAYEEYRAELARRAEYAYPVKVQTADGKSRRLRLKRHPDTLRERFDGEVKVFRRAITGDTLDYALYVEETPQGVPSPGPENHAPSNPF
jgi:hypothetical protein